MGGSEFSRQPEQFHTLQQVVNPGYKKTSTLDQLFPSMNGRGEQDQQRLLMGGMHSPMGESSDTFDRSLWLRNEQPKSIYDLTYNALK